tara:strand:+ start:4540 stop:5805 length:1266 start_codon:yes stop_codon:yes gene_type:complete
MPAIQGRTLKQLRQAVGFNLGALHTGTAYDAGSNTTLISLSFVGGDDSYNGKWVAVADASNSDSTEFRIISDYTASAYRATLQQQLSFATAAGDSYEIWDQPYKPETINEFINQAIVDSTGLVYDPIENISLHGDGKQTRYDIPSGISQISKIEYRNKISYTRLHDCGTTFDEKTDSDFTQSLDTKDKKQGTQALKMVIASGASAGDFVTDSITSKNISGYDYIEMWVKSTVATSAGNLKLLLDDSASCASPLETLSIPALSADTWTFVRMQLSTPELDTAIISVGLEYDSDLGACTVWIDDITAVKNDTAEWSTLDRRLWKIDKEARDLILLRDGQDAIGYSLIKITGGDKPATLSSETDTTEIPERFIVAFATMRALLANSGGASTDPDSKRQLAAYWDSETNRAKASFPMLTNVRTVY